MRDDKENVIVKKSFEFALKIIEFAETLESQRKFVFANQILKSGTSIGANIREAQNAESKADFIHKLGIAQKECDETTYWLELLKETDYLTDKEFESINSEATELLKMIRSAIITSKKKQSENS